MKWLRAFLLSLAGLLLVTVLLVWFLPASLALPYLQKHLGQLQLRDVHGLLWDGGGELIDVRGQDMGQLQWQLSRLAVLGQLRAQLQFKGPQLAFSGAVAKTGDADTTIDNAQLHVDLALLTAAPGAPLGTPRGLLDAQIPHALLQGPWPQQLDAQAQWHAARMQVVAGESAEHGAVAANDVALGELNLALHAEQGVLSGTLRDDGKGPIQIDGQMQVSPLGWRFQAHLHPRGNDPALLRWLQQFGAPDAAGNWQVERSGGLAAKGKHS